MRHISITGPNAGQILCGADRHNLPEGDTSAHWPYSFPNPQAVDLYRSTACKLCLAHWDAADPAFDDGNIPVKVYSLRSSRNWVFDYRNDPTYAVRYVFIREDDPGLEPWFHKMYKEHNEAAIAEKLPVKIDERSHTVRCGDWVALLK